VTVNLVHGIQKVRRFESPRVHQISGYEITEPSKQTEQRVGRQVDALVQMSA
jgi:hypothetical protein